MHGGILARRDLPEHLATIDSTASRPSTWSALISTRSRETSPRPACTLEDAIENIDIGGPAMVRSSAQITAMPASASSPTRTDYAPLLDEMKANDGALQLATRFALAAFTHTRPLRRMIANWLTGLDDGAKPNRPHPAPSIFPAKLQLAFDKVEIHALRREPAPEAAFYRDTQPVPGSIAAPPSCRAKNCPTTTSPMPMPRGNASRHSTPYPACVIVKHANPCGVAVDAKLLGAYEKAFKTDSHLGLRRHHRLQRRSRPRRRSR